ncbi:MAG: chemotaxis protein CheA [Oligoflexus sp.]
MDFQQNSDEQAELISIFVDESSDIIERIRDNIEDFSSATDRDERFKDILRNIHTIKGGSGTCGFHTLKREAHSLEDRLLAYKDRADEIPAEILDVLQRATDRFKHLLDAGPDQEQVQHQEHTPNKTNQGFGFFDDITETGTPKQKTMVAKKAPSKESNNKKTSEMVRVPLDRIQRNIDVVSEIFLIRNQIKYMVERKNAGKISDQDFMQQWEILDDTLRKSIGDLENIAMSLRMMPIKPVFRMMEATVRNYVQDTGKNILLETTGSETNLDKRILDTMGEPLIHLVRNAMDHGIEDAETRRQVGKPVQAKIKLNAQLEGNEVIVSVSDDGGGIDDQKVLASAKNKGLDVSHVQNREDAIHLIFHPGFSTKQEASDVSGRGIGMDAVKNYVESLGGNLEVHTEIGRGSQFSMRIPLGLSVIRALIAKVNGVTFAISSSEVLEIQRVPVSELKVNGKDSYFKHHGQFLPCYNIADYIYTSYKKEFKIQKRKLAILNVKTTTDVISLRVDELISNVEIVVKPPPEEGLNLPYITGVAILADGIPTFVISMTRLYEKLIKPGLSSDKRGSHAA